MIRPTASASREQTSEIKFYGVIIAIGVLLAVTYCLRRAKQFGVTQDDILNLVLICLPSAIVGARLYYVIFEWDQFFGPGIPWYRFLDIRSGGLAIYGGVIGAVLGMLIYTRVPEAQGPALSGPDRASVCCSGRPSAAGATSSTGKPHGSVTT